MTATDRTQAVDSCIQSLMDLADRSGGFPEAGSVQQVVLATLEIVGKDAVEPTKGRTMLEDSLLTKANLVAPAAPEVAGVLMQAYQVTATS